MAQVIMVLGGSSSGKSAYAEKLTREMEARQSWPVHYLATGTIWDDEFARRVELHRQRRPASWDTIEEPYDLAGVLRSHQNHPAIYLVDGIGTWVANLLFEEGESDWAWDDEKEKKCLLRLQDFIKTGARVTGAVIMGADETGSDMIPENQQARVFQKLNGLVNQVLAAAADSVYWMTSGLPLPLKGGGGS